MRDADTVKHEAEVLGEPDTAGPGGSACSVAQPFAGDEHVTLRRDTLDVVDLRARRDRSRAGHRTAQHDRRCRGFPLLRRDVVERSEGVIGTPPLPVRQALEIAGQLLLRQDHRHESSLVDKPPFHAPGVAPSGGGRRIPRARHIRVVSAWIRGTRLGQDCHSTTRSPPKYGRSGSSCQSPAHWSACGRASLGERSQLQNSRPSNGLFPAERPNSFL